MATAYTYGTVTSEKCLDYGLQNQLLCLYMSDTRWQTDKVKENQRKVINQIRNSESVEAKAMNKK